MNRVGGRRLVRRRGHGERGRQLRVGDVAVDGLGRLLEQASRGEIGRQPDLRAGTPGQRCSGAVGLAVDEADRRHRRVGAEGRRGNVRRVPHLLGYQADPGGHSAHRREQLACRCRLPGDQVMLAALGREHWPGVAGAHVQRRPRPTFERARVVRQDMAVAIPVAVVAQPPRAARRLLLDGLVRHRQRVQNVRVGGRQLAEANQLEESGIDDRALVERRAAIADVVADRRIRITGLGKPDEVRPTRQRAVRRDGPALDGSLVPVRGREPDPGVGRRSVLPGDRCGCDQPGDLGRDC